MEISNLTDTQILERHNEVLEKYKNVSPAFARRLGASESVEIPEPMPRAQGDFALPQAQGLQQADLGSGGRLSFADMLSRVEQAGKAEQIGQSERVQFFEPLSARASVSAMQRLVEGWR